MRPLLGVLGLLLVALATLVVLAQRRWRAGSVALVARFRQAAPGAVSARCGASELRDLPDPVARYLGAALPEGQRRVRLARLRQTGRFLVRPQDDAWAPFEATQHLCARPTGFVWDARMRLGAGIAIRVRDSFVDGRGSMRASLLGLIGLVSAQGTPELAAAALMRYLAEAAWLPTALLPAAGVVWSPLDATASRATLGVAGTTVSLDFRFGKDGLVESVFAQARGREVEGRSVPTPWQGRWSEYAERHGMKVPLAGEVEWLLPEGPQVYWRGRVEAITYEYEAG